MIPGLVAIAGYLLGSIPFGLLIAKAKGIDIRQHGSGNIGATNVLRIVGKKWGVLVFILDTGKGVVAVIAAWLIAKFFSSDADATALSLDQLKILAGIACILGHNFPVWLGFKGGKGVATSAGVLLGLMPMVALAGAAVWVVLFYGTRFVAIASMGAALSLPILVFIFDREFNALFYFTLVIAALVVLRHHTNIRRLIDGTEHKFDKSKK